MYIKWFFFLGHFLGVFFLGVYRNVYLLFQITLISAFAFPHWPPRGINVYFAFCIVFILLSHLILVSGGTRWVTDLIRFGSRNHRACSNMYTTNCKYFEAYFLKRLRHFIPLLHRDPSGKRYECALRAHCS